MKKFLAGVFVLAMCHAAAAQQTPVQSIQSVLPSTPSGQQSLINGTPWVNGRGLLQGPNWRDNYQIIHDILNNMGVWSPSGVYTPTIGGNTPAKIATSGNAADVSMSAQGGTVTLDLVRREFLTRPVYAADFGEDCDGVSDNYTPYKNAAAYAVQQGRGLEFGSGACLVLQGSVPINGPLYDIGGKGFGVTNVQARFNGPTFVWTVNGYMENFRVHDMTLSSYFSPAPLTYPSLTTAFDIKGDNTGIMQHGSFDNLRLLGFFAGMTFEKALPSTPDSFGLEGTTDWLAFNNISCKTSTQDGQWCLWFKQGSGTGNTFSNMRTTITGSGTGSSLSSAAIRYDGPANTVVGDQIVTGGHFGGVHGVFSVATGTVYRANMSVVGSQLDAGVSNMADLPSDAPTFSRLNFSTDNIGGGVALTYPPISTSIVDDQLVDQRRAGSNGLTLGNNSSPASTNLFSATTGSTTNPNFYGGTACDLTVNGLVAGVASGVTKASFLLPYSPGGFGTPVLDRQTQSTASSSFFTINATSANGTVTFSVAYTAAVGGIINDAQITCRGGTYNLKRLL